MALSYMNSGPFTGVAGEALAVYRRVKMINKEWYYADNTDEALAITGPNPVGAGEQVVLYPCNAANIVPVTGDNAIASGATIYGANDGKVTDEVGPARPVGILLSAITADGGVASALINCFAANQMIPNTDFIDYFEDFITGAVYAGNKFSETADQAEWLKTSVDTNTDGADVCKVVDDAPGGILQLTCNDNAADMEDLQMNGESFKLVADKPLWFEARFANLDVDTDNFLIGLGITDTGAQAAAGTLAISDFVGFHNLHTGTVLGVVCQDSTSTTCTAGTLADCAAVTSFNTYAKKFGFYWDGAGHITFFLDGVMTNYITDNGSTVVIPDDEALTPTISIGNSTAATATAFIDYIRIVSLR